jgi:exonuclease SbcC
MRINKVTASAFGPLVADETLTLAPGMTVIAGDNESAKSTWHAAVYAALCGIRRGKGATPKDERRFADLHRPWDDDRWVVSANITLDDGRTVEMYQDLAGKVDCRARDLGMGATDISNEIMFEGSPDASRWLGLDRRSFAATAIVNQTELMKILTDADGLQDALQRAAATAGTTDATAAAALSRLKTFRAEHVGLDRANSGKPLHVAKNTLAVATTALAAARAAHEQYLALVTDTDQAHQDAHKQTQQVTTTAARTTDLEALAELVRTCTTAASEVTRLTERTANLTVDMTEVTDKLERATILDAQFAGHAPTGTAADEDTAALVAVALAEYRAMPAEVTLSGLTATQLATALAELPPAPVGDTSVAAEVKNAAWELSQCAGLLSAHAQDRPAPPAEMTPAQIAASAAGADLLREIATELTAPVPNLPEALTEAVAAAQKCVTDAAEPITSPNIPIAGPNQSPGRTGTILVGLGVVVAVAALVAIATGAVIAGVAALSLGLLSAGVGVALHAKAGHISVSSAPHGRDERLLAAQTTLAGATARLDAQQSVVDAALAARAAVLQRTQRLALPAEPVQLRAAATDIEHRNAALTAQLGWDRRQGTLQDARQKAETALSTALDARQASPGPEPAARYAQYERDCARDVTLAAAAGRADQLTLDHRTRVGLEQAAEVAGQRRAEALTSLRRAAEVVAVLDHDSAPAPDVATGLSTWQQQRLTDVTESESAQRDWAQLNALLAGKPLAALAESAVTLTAAAASAQVELDGALSARAAAAGDRAAAMDALGLALDISSATSATEEQVEASVATWLEAAKSDLGAARAVATTAVSSAADADGTLRERARTLPSVAEAEERLQGATTELARVLELDATLTEAWDFLDAAQQRVHRDIAPVLAATLTEWLPRITGWRYIEAAVDPRTLQVSVCGPARNWRPADCLSRGTAEQVYLLLRVALARHLTTAGVSCPLLLDDVTVQADSKRTAAILDLLHELSADQQIIVFGQEEQVADWARQNLTGPDDAVVEVAPVLGT